MTPKQIAWLGVFHIEEAILDKLAEEGRIESRIVGTQKRGWKLSDRERDRRTDS